MLLEQESYSIGCQRTHRWSRMHLRPICQKLCAVWQLQSLALGLCCKPLGVLPVGAVSALCFFTLFFWSNVEFTAHSCHAQLCIWELFLTAFTAIEQFILYLDQTIVLVCSLEILCFTEKQTKSFSIDVISLLGMDLWHSRCKWLQVWHFWLSLLYLLGFDPLASIYVSFHTRLRLQLL